MTEFSGIYAIYRSDSGRRYYIGSAVNIKKRWQRHRSHLRAGVHHSAALQRAWNKHGEAAFQFAVLEAVPEGQLIGREQAWFDRFAPAYNICKVAGSNRGLKFSAEARAKISAALTGRKLSAEHRAKQSAMRLGRKMPPRGPHSPETRAKISEANLRRWAARRALQAESIDNAP